MPGTILGTTIARCSGQDTSRGLEVISAPTGSAAWRPRCPIRPGRAGGRSRGPRVSSSRVVGRPMAFSADAQARGRIGIERRASRPWSRPGTCWAPASPVRSTLIATTSNWSEPSSLCSRSSAGISLRQGAHQVAHRLRSTTLPRQSASVRSRPVGVLELDLRAGPPAPCGTRRPPSAPGSGRLLPGPAGRPAPAGSRAGGRGVAGRANGVVRTAQRHVYRCKPGDRGDGRRPQGCGERSGRPSLLASYRPAS